MKIELQVERLYWFKPRKVKGYGMANSSNKLKKKFRKFSKSFTEDKLFYGKLNNNKLLNNQTYVGN